MIRIVWESPNLQTAYVATWFLKNEDGAQAKRKNESYSYHNVPSGLLLFTYAHGKNYSTECGKFMDNMHAQRSPDRDNYSTGISWTYTLQPVIDGNLHLQNMKAEDF